MAEARRRRGGVPKVHGAVAAGFLVQRGGFRRGGVRWSAFMADFAEPRGRERERRSSGFRE